MLDRKLSIFRKEALDRLSSPERLDELVEVVDPHSWMTLVAAAALIAVALVWSVVGRLPSTVTGRGVLIRPRKVVELQPAGSGRLTALNVRVGDSVGKGTVLGTIDQAELRQELQQQRVRLAELEAQDRAKHSLQIERTELQAEEIAKEKRSMELQRLNRQKRIADAEALSPILKQRLERRKELEARGLLPQISDDRLEAEQTYLQNQGLISSLRVELKDLESRWVQLGSREKALAQEEFDSSSARRNEMQALKARIALLELQLDKDSRIISEYPGRVLELSANVGQFVGPNHGLGLLEVDDSAIQPAGAIYFAIKDGKRLQPGMKVQVAPDSVQRERFGGIVGRVRNVSPFPVTKAGATSMIGNSEVAESLLSDGPQIEVIVDLERDPSTISGYRWTSSKGPPTRISSGVTATARVTVEGRAPITYLLPFLRSTVGTY